MYGDICEAFVPQHWSADTSSSPHDCNSWPRLGRKVTSVCRQYIQRKGWAIVRLFRSVSSSIQWKPVLEYCESRKLRSGTVKVSVFVIATIFIEVAIVLREGSNTMDYDPRVSTYLVVFRLTESLPDHSIAKCQYQELVSNGMLSLLLSRSFQSSTTT